MVKLRLRSEHFSTDELFKGALVRDVTPELTPLRIVIVKMDHLTNLFIVFLTIGFVVGFGSGYGIRAGISHYRRSIAKRSRMF